MKTMNTLLKITLAVVSSVLLLSCSEKEEPRTKTLEPNYVNIHGVWKTVEMNGIPMSEDVYVYTVYNRKDYSFEQYMNIDSMYPRKLTGYFKITEDEDERYLISGSYSHIGDWNGRYVITEMTDQSMTWVNAGNGNTQKAVRCDAVPEEIREQVR